MGLWLRQPSSSYRQPAESLRGKEPARRVSGSPFAEAATPRQIGQLSRRMASEEDGAPDTSAPPPARLHRSAKPESLKSVTRAAARRRAGRHTTQSEEPGLSVLRNARLDHIVRTPWQARISFRLRGPKQGDGHLVADGQQPDPVWCDPWGFVMQCRMVVASRHHRAHRW